jgi:hypothetical protein
MLQNHSKPVIQIALTPEQQQPAREGNGQRILSLKLEPLEARIAPRCIVKMLDQASPK